ncbi:radical SAM protein [Candidatus Woesearchaeota archaeon]|nr:radical SAM protein [Candidatus Woesearchaeota archaeon]
MITTLYKLKNGIRAFRRWMIPAVNAKLHPKEFRPVLSYLFTEWKCNIDCHYCFQFDNKQNGMTLETAKKSIDWLKSKGCRVLALMGGEVLLRPGFILDVINYGVKQGFFVYLPTNGYLLTKDFIDKAGRAGVAAINLAVDCVTLKPGLPKALMSIEKQFRYLVKKQEEYGYVLFFNINITSKNLKDVKMLTEIARANGIGTDYHVNEPPQTDQPHYQHNREEALYIKEEQFEEFDELMDWLIDKNKQGYPMVNHPYHFEHMKKFVRGEYEPWKCVAGKNGCFIKMDGSLSPCFGLQSSDMDWGKIGNSNFDQEKLDEIKKECNKHCLSTCFYTSGKYYGSFPDMYRWIMKHTKLGRNI